MRRFVLAVGISGLLWAANSLAADWPQFRYDSGRTAASPEQLPADLHLLWVRELPEPRPAFPIQVRLLFDASYEPVVLGKRMFVPSMVTDTVTALDTDTGAELWRFFADGPVRFAPVTGRGKVYFVSDDGNLYCLDAENGKLRWKFSGVPSDRQDRKLLGNGRLISLWPARGGPVLAGEVIYFGAGLWPSEGVSIHALDADSGQVLWSNTDSNSIPKANMDHGIAQYAGLTPQGYLAVVNQRLVVPCGAQLPAFLDTKTGALDAYQMGWGGRIGLPKGSWLAAGVRNYLSHSGDLYDTGRTNDESFDDPRYRNDFKGLLYPGGYTRLRIDPKNQKGIVGPFRQPVLTPTAMYDNDSGIVAHDLTDVKLEQRRQSEATAFRRNDHFPDKWIGALRELWKLPSKLQVHIKAGQHLYAGGPGAVEAVRIPVADEKPEVTWRASLEGTPHRMLAADSKLFVVTREGRICAFGVRGEADLVVHNKPEPAPPSIDRWSQESAKILETTKVTDGYALVLGITTGRLVEELVRQSQLHVIAVCRDAGKVAELRDRLHRAGLYGTRATVHHGDPLSYPLPPYLASLVVSENPSALGTSVTPTLLEAVSRPLRPYGGTACLAIPAGRQDALNAVMSDAGLTGMTARHVGDWTLLSRQGPLVGSADWSHEEADSANTGASRDEAVRSPLALLWFDASRRWHRKPGSLLVRVAGGRVFVKSERLLATDVYTGRPLWETALPFPHSPTDQLVAVEDAVYVTGGRTCLVLDPATGTKQDQIDLPDDLSGVWSNLRVWEGYLIGQIGKHLVCANRRSGETRWKREFGRAGLSIAVGGGRVFCAELVNRQRGEKESEDTKTRALDIETGELLWEIAGGSPVRFSEAADLVVTSSAVYRGSDGSLAWKLPKIPRGPNPNEPIPEPLFIIGQRLLRGTPDRLTVYNLQSGEQEGGQTMWVRRGCTGLRASTHLVTTRLRANSAYMDLASRSITSLWNVRPGCYNSLFPANGALSLPDVTGGCECNYTPTSQAYVPVSVIERPRQP
jgi:outer membrane protein assembly factor BamB